MHNKRRNEFVAAACATALVLAACAGTGAGSGPQAARGGAAAEQPADDPSEPARKLYSGDGNLVRSGVPPAERAVGAPAPSGLAAPAVAQTQHAPQPPPPPAAESSVRIFKGSGEVIAPPAQRPSRAPASKEVSFKFEQAPVREVVHAVIGELLGYTYVLHQPIAGTVTVSTAAPMAADQALSVLESVLQANGLLMAQDSAGVFHVGPPDALRGVVPAPKRIEQAPLPPGFGTVIVPLKYIGASEMAEILRPIARPEALLRVDVLRNLLILAGSRNQIDGWLEIVRTFDVDLLKGMSVGVFPLQYTSVRDVDSALRSMASPDAGAAAPAAPAATGAAGATAPAAVAALPRHPLLGALRVIPVDRLNSLIVISPRAAYLDEVKEWIQRLDRPSGAGTEPRLFVYQVQNGSASHLASVLSALFGGGSGLPGAADSGVAPGLRSATGATARPSAGAAAALPQVGTSALGGGTTGTRTGTAAGLGAGTLPQAGARAGGGAGLASVALGAGIRIVGDDLNNAVLVYAPPAEFRRIEDALKRLDAPATQVLVEATIIEVSLRDEMQYGLQWYFTDSNRAGLNGVGQLNTNNLGGIRPVQPGFSYSLIDSIGQIRVVLNMLADRSLIRVISSPSLMVIDNHTASIMVGDQQPIRSSETVTEGGNVTTSIEYKDTGVMLTVTPSVNSGEMVAMTINQSVVDVGSIDIATGQRAFLQRQIGSRVAVRSGEALVLGGLIRDNASKGSTGIPLLSNIPVVGALFGTQTQDSSRTELLVVITPRVVRTPHDARAVGAEMRDRMRGFSTLVDQQSPLLPKPLVDQVAPARPEPPTPAALPQSSTSQESGKP
jgi:general secretion pathway protein D